MSSAALHEGGLPAQLPQVQVRGDAPGATTTATSGADPAQAALILLLAGEVVVEAGAAPFSRQAHTLQTHFK